MSSVTLLSRKNPPVLSIRVARNPRAVSAWTSRSASLPCTTATISFMMLTNTFCWGLPRRPASAPGEPWHHRRENRGCHLIGVGTCVDDNPAIWVLGRKLKKCIAHPAMKAEFRDIQPVHLRGVRESPLQTDLHRQVKQDTEVWNKTACRVLLDRFQRRHIELPAAALVGEGGVDIPIADDHRARLQCRPQDFSDMLSAGR